MLSIIVPAAENELSTELKNELQRISQLKEIELIFVEKKDAYSRAERINIGVEQSKGQIILLHHPRSIIDAKGIEHLRQLSLNERREKNWGGFKHKFNNNHFLLKFTSWYSNKIRGSLRGIIYLDHCIFFDRDLWQRKLPPVEIFEDTILSKYFQKFSQPIFLNFSSTTSAIRFEKKGIWKQSALNQLLKIGFFLHLPHSLMNRVYENGLELNSSYTNLSKNK